MAHYILADDFDFDSIIIKEIDFDLVETKLTLKFTYNDDHTLESTVDFGTVFASVAYVDNKVLESLKPYSTTAEVGELIANALQEYDKSDVVTNKINESIADALNEYYTRSEIDAKDNALKEDYIQRDENVTNNLTTKINAKAISGVKNTFSTDTNAITTTVYQADGTSQVGIATIPNGTNSESGLISAAQTKKLNNIADGANKYELPVATENALGGIYAATGDDGYTNEVKIKDGKLYTRPGDYDLPVANANTLGGVKPTATKTSAYTVPVAVDSDGGLFTIPGNYELPLATSDALGGVKIGYTENAKNYAVKVDSNGKMYVTVNWSDTTYSVATTSANGLMSSSDKSKLNGIAANANNYSLPTMTASVKGGAKAGSGLEMNGEALNVKTDGITTAIQSGAVEVLTDGETVQAGTNGLEVKVDNSTIKVGDNGLYANVETAPAIFINTDDVIYSGDASSYSEMTYPGVTFDIDVIAIGAKNLTSGTDYTFYLNGVICGTTNVNTPTFSLYVKKGQLLRIRSFNYVKIFSLQS